LYEIGRRNFWALKQGTEENKEAVKEYGDYQTLREEMKDVDRSVTEHYLKSATMVVSRNGNAIMLARDDRLAEIKLPPGHLSEPNRFDIYLGVLDQAADVIIKNSKARNAQEMLRLKVIFNAL
jgi:hypothetical protein